MMIAVSVPWLSLLIYRMCFDPCQFSYSRYASFPPKPQRGGCMSARGKPRFAAPPRVHVPDSMAGVPMTACQTGGLRDRNRPRAAARAFDVHTGAWPNSVVTRHAAARGGLGLRRLHAWSWARPRCAGRWLTRGGAAKRGLPRATIVPPRCGSERTPPGIGVQRRRGRRQAMRNGPPMEQISQP